MQCNFCPSITCMYAVSVQKCGHKTYNKSNPCMLNKYCMHKLNIQYMIIKMICVQQIQNVAAFLDCQIFWLCVAKCWEIWRNGTVFDEESPIIHLPPTYIQVGSIALRATCLLLTYGLGVSHQEPPPSYTYIRVGSVASRATSLLLTCGLGVSHQEPPPSYLHTGWECRIKSHLPPTYIRVGSVASRATSHLLTYVVGSVASRATSLLLTYGLGVSH